MVYGIVEKGELEALDQFFGKRSPDKFFVRKVGRTEKKMENAAKEKKKGEKKGHDGLLAIPCPFCQNKPFFSIEEAFGMRFWIGRILLTLKKFFLKLSSMLGTLVILILKPKDHERLTRHFYQTREAIRTWGGPPVTEQGLIEEEEVFVHTYLRGGERCLVLHCGGGREAIALAKKGFRVTGVDRSKTLIDAAEQYVEKEDLSCTFLVQDGLALSLEERFDAVFLGSNMYSAIPLKEWRIGFLRRIGQHLTEGGLFYLKFATGVSPEELRSYPIKKSLARMFGNRFYELGDSLFAGWHYQHSFVKEGDLRQEIEASGLEAVALHFDAGYAVLRGR